MTDPVARINAHCGNVVYARYILCLQQSLSLISTDTPARSFMQYVIYNKNYKADHLLIRHNKV